MVRYKLGIFSKGQGRVIDLDSIKKIEDLKSLDKFTSSFNNENELKLYLFNYDLLSKFEMSQNITIMYKNNGKIKKIPVIYNDINELLDVVNLRYKLMSMNSNIKFLEKLSNYYSNGSTKFNKQGLNVSDIRTYLSDVRRNEGKIYSSKLLDTALDDLFKKAVLKIDKLTGETEINYRGLRDLAVLIYKFESNQDKKSLEEQKENVSWIQGSLFDIEEIKESDFKNTLSSDGEPDFPPNSEEEAKYQAYQAKLLELSDQNIDPYDEFYGYKKR